MKYFKPWSLTWWAGVMQIAVGLFVATEPMHMLYGLAETASTFTGNAPPVVLIGTGLGLIGLRAAPGVANG